MTSHINQNDIEIIKFVEEEFQLNDKLGELLDRADGGEDVGMESLLLIDEVIKAIAETKGIQYEEAGHIYESYQQMVAKAAMVLLTDIYYQD